MELGMVGNLRIIARITAQIIVIAGVAAALPAYAQYTTNQFDKLHPELGPPGDPYLFVGTPYCTTPVSCVDGTGILNVTGTAHFGSVDVGRFDPGIASISGVLTTTFGVNIGAWSQPGSLTVTGQLTDATYGVVVGGAGLLTVTNGGTITTPYYGLSVQGSATVSGGSTITALNGGLSQINVGTDLGYSFGAGPAILAISGGSTVTTSAIGVGTSVYGSNITSSGTLTISGVSTVTASSIAVGNSVVSGSNNGSSGILTISNGSTLNAGSITVGTNGAGNSTIDLSSGAVLNASTIVVNSQGALQFSGSSANAQTFDVNSGTTSIINGGRVLVGLANDPLDGSGGLAIGSSGVLDLTIAAGQTLPEIDTSGTVQLGGTINVSLGAATNFTEGEFVPLIAGQLTTNTANVLVPQLAAGDGALVPTTENVGGTNVFGLEDMACADIVKGYVSFVPTMANYQDGKPTQMTAKFTPPISLNAAAHACGVKEFDWVQTVKHVPPPGMKDSSGNDLHPDFPDPPPGGYDYQLYCKGFLGLYDVKVQDLGSPFYWDPNAPKSNCYSLAANETIQTLTFEDNPFDRVLPLGEFFEFSTCLVGVIEKDGKDVPSDCLYQQNWMDDFNGNPDDLHTGTGGAWLIAPENVQPLDLQSGFGGVSIESTANKVPEPNTFILLTSGLLLLSRMRKRRSKAFDLSRGS